jgi:hypothetical protein
LGKVRVGLLAAAATLVLAGCVARTAGGPERAPAAGEPVRLDYDSLLNEVDPCSLTGPAAYEPHGTARMPGRPDMDRCRVSVATGEGPVHVWVGQAQTTDDRTEVTSLGRGATIERFGDDCDTALVFDETSAIIATAEPAGDEQPSEDLLCALTSGAAEGVFNVLAGDRVKFWTPPSNSFATVSSCDAVDATLLGAEPAVIQLGLLAEVHLLGLDGPRRPARRRLVGPVQVRVRDDRLRRRRSPGRLVPGRVRVTDQGRVVSPGERAVERAADARVGLGAGDHEPPDTEAG